MVLLISRDVIRLSLLLKNVSLHLDSFSTSLIEEEDADAMHHLMLSLETTQKSTTYFTTTKQKKLFIVAIIYAPSS